MYGIVETEEVDGKIGPFITDRRVWLKTLIGIATAGRVAALTGGAALVLSAAMPSVAEAADTKLSAMSLLPNAVWQYAINASNTFGKVAVLGWFNVADYSAVANSNVNGSSGSDQKANIQAAVTAAESVGGGTIYFPGGGGFTYRVDSSITYINNLCVYNFQGAGTANISGGVVGGSAVVGNFAGYIFDRPNISTSGATCIFNKLGVRNANSGGGGIRMLGVDAGSGISHCSIQAGTFGVQLGDVGAPASATFTANSTGTTSLVVTAISGTINTAPAALPCPISGVGVPGATTIVSQVSGTTGGNGTYLTNQVTTLTSASVMTNPNAPTAFCVSVDNCMLNGLGTYNSNPASSFFGVGIQMSPETIVSKCHVNAWAVAIRGYGAGNYCYGNQCESNTTAYRFGTDGAGNNFSANQVLISGGSIEGCVTGVQLWSCNGVVIEALGIIGEVDASHNSTYGILFDGCTDVSLRCVSAGGTYNTAAFYINGAGGAIRRIRAENCTGLLAKDAGQNYSCITAIMCPNFPTLSSTLAQLQAAITAGDVNVGEVRQISDCSVAFGSQTYNGTVSGSGANLGFGRWDGTGTSVRYG